VQLSGKALAQHAQGARFELWHWGVREGLGRREQMHCCDVKQDVCSKQKHPAPESQSLITLGCQSQPFLIIKNMRHGHTSYGTATSLWYKIIKNISTKKKVWKCWQITNIRPVT
jgi:hypothetical protein